jgi:hypothetical protein
MCAGYGQSPSETKIEIDFNSQGVLRMATAATRASIINLVVLATNAAPGTTQLTTLIIASDAGQTLAQIAATLTGASTFTAKYPIFQTNEEFGVEYVNDIIPGASATVRADAAVLITSLLNTGSSRADVLLASSEFLAIAPTTDPSFGTAAATFQNKAAVATYHTITLELDTGLDTALVGVTEDPTTVTSAEATIAAAPVVAPAGQTFTLTTGIDVLASGINTVNGVIDQTTATNTTWGLSDTITSAVGGTVNLTLLNQAGVNSAGYTTKNVTTLNVKGVDQDAASDAYGFDLSGLSGLTNVNIADGTVAGTNDDTLTVSGIASTTTVTLNPNDTDLDILLTPASVAGTTTALSLDITGRSGDIQLTTGIETLNIKGGAGARVTGLDSNTTASLTSVVVTGTDFRSSGFFDSTVKTFDASAATGTINVMLLPGTTLTSAKGGTGTTDSLTVTSLSATNKIEGFETLTAAAGATYDLDAAPAVTALVQGATTGTTVFTNAGATQNVIVVPGAGTSTGSATRGAITYTPKVITGLADALTVSATNFGVATTGTITTGTITTNGVESITIATADAKAVTIGGITPAAPSTTAATTLTASGSSNLTVGTFTNASSSTSVSTVNFSGMTGTTSMTYSGADSVVYTGGSAKDTLTIGAVGAAELQTYNTGAGADVVTTVEVGAAGGAIVIDTGAGDDTITASAFTTSTATGNKLDGGADTDTLVFTAGHDFTSMTNIVNVENIQVQVTGASVDGGAVSGDTIAVTNFGATTARLTVTAAAAGATVDLSKITFVGPNEGLIIAGGAGLDTITGTSKTDTITTGAGAGSVTGGGAADTITGNAGGVDTVIWTGTTAAAIATETGSTAGTDVDFAAGTIGDSVAAFATGTDKLNFASTLVTNAAGTEIDTLLEIAKGGTVTNVARYVQITDAGAGDNGDQFGGAVALLNALDTTAVAIGDSFIAAIDNDTNVYLYLVQQVSAANTIATQDVTLIGALTGITDVANGDFVSV